MKAFKIKATMVQEYVSFGNTREEAIANYEYSQGYDFDQVKINGELFANGNVIDGKVTATSLGKDNIIVFNQKDWKFAKAMWLKNHDDYIYIKNYDGEIVSAMDKGNKPEASYLHELDEIDKKEIHEIADRYKRGSVTPVK